MSYISGSVAINQLTVGETAVLLCDWAKTYAVHAEKTVKLPGEKETGLHITVLYHGYPSTFRLENACRSLAFETLSSFFGTVKGLFQVRVPERNIFVLALDVDCPALQDYYPIVRSAVQKATGEESKMDPHLGPNGEHLYKNDFHPHITLAYYKCAADMDADVAAGILNALDALKGATVTIGPFVLHKR